MTIRELFLTVDSLWYGVLNRHRTEAVMSRDWDNLILLDACRFDMFREVNFLEGHLDSIYSCGSSTGHFLQDNFKGQSFFDTVYVSGNPLVNHFVPDSFFAVIPVWQDGWHEEFGTVLPETMVEYSIEAANRYMDKRLILHFMQPHYPFIGEKTRAVIGEHEGIKSRDLMIGKKVRHTQTVWHLFREGILDRQTVWEAYCDNLHIVLEALQGLLPLLSGKTVISSDHGNLFGEWLWPIPVREFGHFGGLYKKSLVQVPWFVCPGEKRKQIQSAEPESKPESIGDREEYQKKLSALGYID